MSTPSAPEPPPAEATAHDGPRPNLTIVVVALTVAIALMLFAFATPAINSGADDLPLAVTGPPSAVERIVETIDERRPGTFDVSTYASVDEANRAIRHRDAIGGLSVDPGGVTVQLASGAGAPYAGLLRSLGGELAATGRPVTYVDLAPLTADDPAGVGLGTIALPMVFGGMVSAVLLAVLMRVGPGRRILGALSVAVVAGSVAAIILQFALGSVDGDFWLTAAGIALGIAAISLAVLGLHRLIGYAGLALGAVIMLFVSNPLSGLTTGPEWLPHPWGEVGQFLPVGAAGTVVRSAAYFDGNGAGRAVLVLACWMAAGALLMMVRRPGTSGRTAKPAGLSPAGATDTTGADG